eukprot:COSAG05_NODE_71_length_22071_cov_17.527149_20_plen_67_part_00
MAGSRSDQIPVHAVHVPVEAAGELADNGTSTGSSGGRGCMKTQQTNPRETLGKTEVSSDCNKRVFK